MPPMCDAIMPRCFISRYSRDLQLYALFYAMICRHATAHAASDIAPYAAAALSP